MTHKELADRREAMREYKASGKTNRDVAEHFGVSYQHTKIICKGIAPQQRHIEGDKDKWLSLFENQHGENWEVVGHFVSVDAHIDIKCKHCGTVKDYPCASVRKGYQTIECAGCKRRKLEQQEEDRRVRQRQQLIKAVLKEEETQQKEAAKWHKCPTCGKLTNRRKYCSSQCRNKVLWRNHEIKRRALLNNQIVNTDITLERLYEKDNGICWLCGTKCDWDDYEYRDNWFIAGNFYPSIEHVKPLSKGGEHSWENVRLAHRICNSIKGND